MHTEKHKKPSDWAIILAIVTAIASVVVIDTASHLTAGIVYEKF